MADTPKKLNVWTLVLGTAVLVGTVFAIAWSAGEGWKRGSK